MTEQGRQDRLILAGNIVAGFAILLVLVWMALALLGQRHDYLLIAAIGLLLLGIYLGGGSTLKWLLPF